MPIDLFTGLTKGPQGPELIRMQTDNWGKYWDQAFAGKDDEGFVEKTRIMWKHTFLPATILLIYDVQMFNKTGGIPNVLLRMKWHYLRWLGPPLAYTSIVCCTSALRGKTDQKNHLVGGAAAGAVLGALNKSAIMGGVCGFLFGLVGHLYKDSMMRGYELIPADWAKTPRHGNAFSHKLDYTTNWFKPKPGYWARSEADVERVFNQGQMGDGDSQRRLW